MATAADARTVGALPGFPEPACPERRAELARAEPVEGSKDDASEETLRPFRAGPYCHTPVAVAWAGKHILMAGEKTPDECAFCAIAQGTTAASVVFDDEVSLAFLDRRPLFHGHCLLIPKAHVETLADVPDGLIEPLFRNARLLSRAVKDAMGSQGSFVAMNNTVSQSVPHLHIHIVPRTRGDGLRGFFWPRQKYRDDAHMEKVRRAVVEEVTGARNPITRSSHP